VADATSDHDVSQLVERTVERLGGVDILVNNAAVPGGSGGSAGAINAALTDIAYDFDAKVLGYLRTARAVAPHLQGQGWGRIIHIGGLSARQTGSLSASVRNLGIVAVSKTLADELGSSGVTVNVLHPGRTRTTETDEPPGPDTNSIGRVVDAIEVAWLAAFLASPRSSAINGEVIACGGGTPRQLAF
jgi:NAD(P)-dependent dehydrogenase (short-subunit alcohol dehydrogenase family)